MEVDPLSINQPPTGMAIDNAATHIPKAQFLDRGPYMVLCALPSVGNGLASPLLDNPVHRREITSGDRGVRQLFTCVQLAGHSEAVLHFRAIVVPDLLNDFCREVAQRLNGFFAPAPETPAADSSMLHQVGVGWIGRRCCRFGGLRLCAFFFLPLLFFFVPCCVPFLL